LDAHHLDLRPRKPDPSSWQHDIPVRFRKYLGKRHQLKTNARDVLSRGSSQLWIKHTLLSAGRNIRWSVRRDLHPDRGCNAAQATQILTAPPHARRLGSVLYFLYNALTVYYNLQSNVAYISHVIGFTIGLPLGIAWSPTWKKNLLISISLLIPYFVLLYLLTTYVLPRLGIG